MGEGLAGRVHLCTENVLNNVSIINSYVEWGCTEGG